MNRRRAIITVVLIAAFLAASATVLLRRDPGLSDQTVIIGGGSSTTSTVPTTTLVADAGSPGLGDSLYPRLGNGGYDAAHYVLEITYDPDDGVLIGTSTMTATATQRLAAFNLDMAGLLASGVTVDGQKASFVQEAFELVITPSSPIENGSSFVVVVEYGGIPELFASAALPGRIGWFADAGTAYVMSEPDATSTWFPVNDHPLDKATFSIRVSVPTPLTAASNGVLVETLQDGANTVFVFEHDYPMASYLVALGIGELELFETESPTGVPIRDYIDIDVGDEVREAFSRQGEMIDFFQALFGPYPFETYGALVIETNTGAFGALETQTLSTFPIDVGAVRYQEFIVAHEAAHSWFGNSLSPADWTDIWLNEGFATYSDWMWSAQASGEGAPESEVRDIYALVSGQQSFDDGIAAAQVADFIDQTFPPIGSLPSDDLFNLAVYWRGALTLHALRLRMGDEAFFDGLRTYAERFAYGNVTTDDFIVVMEDAAGEQLREFFDAWLNDRQIPPIPEMGLVVPEL